MATHTTQYRNYLFPLKDENLEASNFLLQAITDTIDGDINTLFTEKANIADTDTSGEVDTKISTAITDYDTNLDIYGTYANGDVNTDPIEKTKLLLETIATAGTYTKLTINEKGLVTGGVLINKADLQDFTESEYVHWSEVDDNTTSTTKLWSSDKTNAMIGAVSSAQSNYVLLSSYDDSDVLAKVKNVDGTGSGLDADLLDGQDGSYYLDWVNFSNTPTTLASYGITDAYTKSETEALNWDWSHITGEPELSINSVDTITSSNTTELDFDNEVFDITLGEDSTFSTSNIVNGKRGVFLIRNTGNATFTVDSGLSSATVTFDITAGLQSADANITVGNLSSGTAADLVGKWIRITMDTVNDYYRKVSSESSGVLTLTSALPAGTLDTGTGNSTTTLVVTSISAALLDGRRVSILTDGVNYYERNVELVDGNNIILETVIASATADSGTGETFNKKSFPAEITTIQPGDWVWSGKKDTIDKVDYFIIDGEIFCELTKDYK